MIGTTVDVLNIAGALDADAKVTSVVAPEGEAPTFFGVVPVPTEGASSLSIVANKSSSSVHKIGKYKD